MHYEVSYSYLLGINFFFYSVHVCECPFLVLLDDIFENKGRGQTNACKARGGGGGSGDERGIRNIVDSCEISHVVFLFI